MKRLVTRPECDRFQTVAQTHGGKGPPGRRVRFPDEHHARLAPAASPSRTSNASCSSGRISCSTSNISTALARSIGTVLASPSMISASSSSAARAIAAIRPRISMPASRSNRGGDGEPAGQVPSSTARRASARSASVRPCPHPTSSSVPPGREHALGQRRAIDRIAAELAARERPGGDARAGVPIGGAAHQIGEIAIDARATHRRVGRRSRRARRASHPTNRLPIRTSIPTSPVPVVFIPCSVSGWNDPRRSHAPVCISANNNHGATSGFEMFAARYIFRRFNPRAKPTDQHISR